MTLTSAPTRQLAKTSGILNGAALALMWVLEVVDVALRQSLNWFGVHSWRFDQIWTILTAPLTHAGFSHLIANSVPFAVLGFFVALEGPRQWWQVTLAGALGSGLFAFFLNTPGTLTVGASGVVFSYLTYLVVRGWFVRKWPQVLVAAGVALVYGSVLWGVLPTQPGVSWQGHLGGAVAGVGIAWWLHSRQQTRRPR